MSKIGDVNLQLQELIEDMGLDATQPLSDDVREAVKSSLNETIRTNSCEANCPHNLMIGLL